MPSAHLHPLCLGLSGLNLPICNSRLASKVAADADQPGVICQPEINTPWFMEIWGLITNTAPQQIVQFVRVADGSFRLWEICWDEKYSTLPERVINLILQNFCFHLDYFFIYMFNWWQMVWNYIYTAILVDVYFKINNTWTNEHP